MRSGRGIAGLPREGMAQTNYSFDFDFGFLIIFLISLGIAFIVMTFPYRVIGLARSNCYRKDGRISPNRTKREIRKATSLVGELLLFPLISAGVITGVLLAIHTFVIPVPLVVDVAQMFSPDAAVWDERTETGELGDVGRIYEEWNDERGYSDERNYSVRKFLKRNWFVLALLALAGAGLTYWFVTGYYVQAVTDYHDGLLRRKERYAKRDDPE